MEARAVRVIECDNCQAPWDGTSTRWLCPRCGMKASCCEGAPLPACRPQDGTEPGT